MQVSFAELTGKTITSVTGLHVGSESVKFTCNDGSEYEMYHMQDCCESVDITDVCGDIEDIINSTIHHAEERCTDASEHSSDASATWTFYDIWTRKGCVNIRWLGESNGYYSESVSFTRTKSPD